jgi:hypothetical protein
VEEGSGPGARGERFFRRVWGWSMSSTAEASTVARERLGSILANLRSNTRAESYYPRVPLREPILDELDIDGEQFLVITRNRYGAEILNTDRLLIADIDLPELERPARVRRWPFRRPAPTPSSVEPAPVVERLGQLASWAQANPAVGVVVYRTASGLRVFVTGLAEPASSAGSDRILTELGADPIYRELCRTHGTFRARLTPKPWRLPRMRAPLGRWPFESDRVEARFYRWLADYDSASREYAVCRRLVALGPAPSTLEAQIIQRHDDRTRVTTVLPLA